MNVYVTALTGRPVDEEAERALDRRLVEAARTDREAMAALYRRHVHAVYAHAYRLSGSKDVAEEATSATFERTLTGLADFTWQGGGIRPWLLTIAGNEVNACFRRRNRDDSKRAQLGFRDLATSGDETEPTENDTRDAATLVAVRRALVRLPERYRNVVALRYLNGLGAQEAADQLGCSKAVLAVTLHRALGALRRELARMETPTS
jgi:RNA polymerase sigma factor (sigma-70 family)